jgi:hypothetical protein
LKTTPCLWSLLQWRLLQWKASSLLLRHIGENVYIYYLDNSHQSFSCFYYLCIFFCLEMLSCEGMQWLSLWDSINWLLMNHFDSSAQGLENSGCSMKIYLRGGLIVQASLHWDSSVVFVVLCLHQLPSCFILP